MGGAGILAGAASRGSSDNTIPIPTSSISLKQDITERTAQSTAQPSSMPEASELVRRSTSSPKQGPPRPSRSTRTCEPHCGEGRAQEDLDAEGGGGHPPIRSPDQDLRAGLREAVAAPNQTAVQGMCKEWARHCSPCPVYPTSSQHGNDLSSRRLAVRTGTVSCVQKKSHAIVRRMNPVQLIDFETFLHFFTSLRDQDQVRCQASGPRHAVGHPQLAVNMALMVPGDMRQVTACPMKQGLPARMHGWPAWPHQRQMWHDATSSCNARGSGTAAFPNMRLPGSSCNTRRVLDNTGMGKGKQSAGFICVE